MVFSSLTFLYFFLPITLLIYFVSPKSIKNFILLVTGLFFYAWGEPIYVLIMILSAAIDYTAGRIMHWKDNNKTVRTICLIVSVLMNVGLLGIFKYSSFFITNINAVFGTSISDPQLPLPIGISFYTFQSMSYTIDLYRRKIKVQKNVINFMAFVTMFPQIVAGPIVTYDEVAERLDDRKTTVDDIADGIAVFVKGLGKKVLLANNIGLLWSQVKAMDYTQISVFTAWIGIIAFAFQIYFDFSGYSDMAVGLGKMLGFEFPNNFNYPYTSKSISEFWRRWHITLGSWFREYVYIPLGGNRNGTARTIFNLAVTWALTGFWHGASWNFMLWGIYFGILIILERFVYGKLLAKLPKILGIFYTFVLVLFGWVLFETATLKDAFNYFKAMFGATGTFYDVKATYFLVTYGVVLVLCIIGSTQLVKKGAEYVTKFSTKLSLSVRPLIQLAIMLLSTAYLVNETYNPFLYFRF
ncbi:MAG: MBOAT family protein [Oscillospiraceae bacterium]|nr:MBOAT family protein [Oscillospiraceae bacterium]